MNVLLLSMPDSFEHMPPMAIRMPNGALASLAGNVDSHHRVAIADLILVQSSLRSTIERLVREIEPDIVGLSVMTFQRATALAIAKLLRALRPSVRIAVGGYDPSLAPAAYEGCRAIDFIVRGEGEQTLSDLLRALETAGATAHAPRQLAAIAGLSYRLSGGFVRNADRPIMPLASSALRLPNRRARVLGGYTLLGRTVDVVETSRGCTFDCSFCSIIEMRGRNFHPYPIDRVLADIADARANGAEAIFLVDDNITLDIVRFEALCQAIVDAGPASGTCFSASRTCSTKISGSCVRGPRTRNASTGGRSATPASRRFDICTSTACTSWAASSSATRTTPAARLTRISSSPAGTSIGRTSSTRRRTPERR